MATENATFEGVRLKYSIPSSYSAVTASCIVDPRDASRFPELDAMLSKPYRSAWIDFPCKLPLKKDDTIVADLSILTFMHRNEQARKLICRHPASIKRTADFAAGKATAEMPAAPNESPEVAALLERLGL